MKLDGSRIKQAEIKAKTDMIHGIFYVTPTEEELTAARIDFYTPPTGPAQVGGQTTTTATGTTAPPLAPATLTPGDLRGDRVAVVNATGRLGQGAFTAAWLGRQGATVLDITESKDGLPGGFSEVRYPSGRSRTAEAVAQALGISQVTATAGIDQVTVVLGASFQISAAQLAAAQQAGAAPSVPHLADWQRLSKAVTFQLSAPTYIPEGYSYSFQRAYQIVPTDKDKPAVRVGFQSTGEDLFLGVSATTWRDAPLASPGVQVQGDGVIYTVVGSSTKVDHVWWVKEGVLHWVTNTLFADLGREQLLAVAVSSVAVQAPAQ
jgi:hypothetical protein